MYTTLYDIRNGGMGFMDILLLVGGSCSFIVGLTLLLYWRANRHNQPTDPKTLFVGAVAFGMGTIFLLVSLLPLYLTPKKANWIFKNKLYQVVEGVPQHYHPMPVEGHDEERFEVQGVKFHYSDYGSYFGYNNAASHGGVIHPNNYYRITYYPDQDSLEAGGPSILKIEMRK